MSKRDISKHSFATMDDLEKVLPREMHIERDGDKAFVIYEYIGFRHEVNLQYAWGPQTAITHLMNFCMERGRQKGLREAADKLNSILNP